MSKNENVKICVVLSVYNGQKYLEEQIYSILNQTIGHLKIICRNDGSTDDSIKLLSRISEFDDRLLVVDGSNVGILKSFSSILNADCDDYDFYFFSDQDDVWLSDKIERAIDMMSNSVKCLNGLPVCYYSKVTLVDSNLSELGGEKFYSINSANFFLVNNYAVGCTMGFNKLARDLFISSVDYSRCSLHDWWMALTCSTAGVVVSDEESRILYRQHGGNAIGVSVGLFSKIRSTANMFFNGRVGMDGFLQLEALRDFIGRNSKYKFNIGVDQINLILNSRRNIILRLFLIFRGHVRWPISPQGIIFMLRFLLFSRI